jgi:hypothetical protein
VVLRTVLGTAQRYCRVFEEAEELTEIGAPQEWTVGWSGREQLPTGRKTGSWEHAAWVHGRRMRRMIRARGFLRVIRARGVEVR